MEIENGDDAQLQINGTEYLQIPIVIAADLKSNENYTIRTGNPNLSAPQYDLSYFRDSIPKNLPEVAISDIQTQSPEQQQASPKPFWQSQWFLWACIGIGGIVLLLFTRSLIKDMNRNQ
ncbi:hypothetical protein [Flavobacterium sp. 3HN19-14]|uniref:hypothetical protein n=1 Tax=Flavobacterium sp. 3HN19-14 TaxID=3448133 RepID=UPI003EE02DF4